ncbi:MAG: 5'-nucleotidase C-terminal domain-containing protein [Fimbriimonadaceae bacterium]|nr:MAG: 5'-nucleotidase C-terminal domain-containing protein [Fimbriimonadaceae bacterium]
MMKFLNRLLVIGGLASLAVLGWAQEKSFTMTVLHTNDLHSHIEPVVVKGKSVGGYARQASVILKLREESVNPVLFNAGDVFQGTLYFNEYDGLADLAFMNLVGYQAMAVGNHEFDKGIATLTNFARLARFPLLAANLDLSKEPELEKYVKKSTVMEVGGEKIGLIGCVPDELMQVILPIPTIRVLDFQKSIQTEADNLKKQGINKIFLLSHAGIEREIAFSSKFKNIDMIIGGHSHSLLGEVDIPGFTGSRGAYPYVGKDANNEPILVVSAWEWGKVVGKIELEFNEKGVLTKWQGGPVLVDDTWPENPFVASLVAAFEKPINVKKNTPIAKLENDLSQRWDFDSGEGLMGNVIADAVLAKTKGLGSVAAFWNAGGVRSSLSAGQINYGSLVEVCPFGNTLVVIDLTGKEIMDSIELGLLGGGMLLPSKGFSYTFDPAAAPGQRLKSASLNGQAIVPTRTYKVTVSNFTVGGGDGHEVLKNAKGTRIDTGFIDLEALIEYFQSNTPVKMTNEGRIKTT